MGGSSGGGSSGQVSYPAYMETIHGTWLTAVAADIVTAKTGDNPYTTAVAYDPDCVLNATNYIISLFYDDLLLQLPETDWSTNYDAVKAKYTKETITAISAYSFDTIFDDAHMVTLVNAYTADLEARRDADFKPAYKVGMLNVNAVMSSSFPIGDALLTSEVARGVARFSGELYYKNEDKKLAYQTAQANENTGHNTNIINRDQLSVKQNDGQANFSLTGAEHITNATYKKLDFYRLLAHLTTDANRIKIVAKNEESDKNLDYDVKDDLYDLELYQYGGNMLAAISGGTASTADKPSTAASVLGGALSGAAAGATVGGPVGAGIGAVVGGLAGLLN